MVNSCIPPALILVSACLLSACGDIKGALDFNDTRNAFESRSTALQARSNTAYRAVPDTGTTTFNGEASLGLGTRSEGLVLIGQAQVIVDFDDASVSGQLDSFTGFDMNEEFVAVSGELVLEDGQIGANSPNDVDAQIAGTLSGGGYVIDVDAFWDGHLKGTPIVGILGDTTPEDSTFMLNGEEVAGGIIIAAE